MTTVKQMTLFAFEYEEKPKGPVWLEDIDGNHRTIPRMDAEATVEYLHKVPAEKGSWWRCLVIDHDKCYNSDQKDWDVNIWLQRGIGIRKKAKYTGEIMDCIDPHPYKWHYFKGKQIHAWKYEPLEKAWIEGDVLHITTESGEYLSEIVADDTIDKYDLHPYRPDFDLEHFLMECIRHKVPKEMMGWSNHYVYATPALSPFSRAMDEKEIGKIDPMGQVPGAIIENEHFSQICSCAEYIGMRLQLSHYVPALKNMAMYPIEETCKTCLRRKSKNKDKCDGSNTVFCNDYMWDRKTPAKRFKSKKKKEPEDCENE